MKRFSKCFVLAFFLSSVCCTSMFSYSVKETSKNVTVKCDKTITVEDFVSILSEIKSVTGNNPKVITADSSVSGISASLDGKKINISKLKLIGSFSEKNKFPSSLESADLSGLDFSEVNTNYMFKNCSSLKTVKIPDSATSIEKFAFYGCSELETITIPDGVTNLSKGLFTYCTKLNNVTFPKSLKTIEKEAFRGCGIKNITIPEGVKTIESKAFYDCYYLETATIPGSVTVLNEELFSKCSNLTSVTILDGVETIETQAFYKCDKLKEINLPSSIKKINKYAVSSCDNFSRINIEDLESWFSIDFCGEKDKYGNNPWFFGRSWKLYVQGNEIKDLVIPQGVTTLKKYRFQNCVGLTSVTIPSNVTKVEANVFQGCINLKKIITNDIKDWLLIDFENDWSHYFVEKEYDLYVNNQEVKDLVIPEGVTTIKDYAFCRCKSLTSVTIPDSVKTIKSNAFYACTNLTRLRVNINDLITCLSPDFDLHISHSWDLYIKGQEIKDLIIPEGVTTIRDNAFAYCENITSVTIPSSVTSIGKYAFAYCNSLTSIAIPSSVTHIESSAFEGCQSLTRVDITDLKSWLSIDFDCFVDREIQIDGITPSNPLNNAGHLYLNGEEIIDLVIPEGTTVIKRCAFEGCVGIRSITIPSSVKRIEAHAFWFDFPEYKTIKLNVKDLKSWLSMNLEISSTSPFDWNTILDLYINNQEITDLVIPEGETTIKDSEFANFGKLTSITIPDSVTSIDYRAFLNCTSLTSITIPSSVTTIGNYAFDGIPKVIYKGNASGAPWGAEIITDIEDEIPTDTHTEPIEIKTTVKECYDKYWYFVGDGNFDIYESCSFDKRIGKTKDLENFEILELHLIEYIDKTDGKNSVLKGETWVKIRTENLEGYLCKSSEEIIDPFLEFEKKYPIVEEFNTSKEFTARKLQREESFLFQDNAKLCDKPGKGSKVIYTFSQKDMIGDYVIVDGLEITNESEIIDESGWSYPWVKVRYKNLEGWIHGSYKETQGWFSRMTLDSPVIVIGSWFGDCR